MGKTNGKNKKSYGGLSVVVGALSIILTVAFSSLCVILDLSGTIDRSITAGLIFVGLIFGVIGIFISCFSHATKPQKNKAATAGLVCSVTAVMLCVYSFILYLDMVYWWTNILNAVAPNLLA